MSLPLFTDTTFEKKDFRDTPLEKGEYENCKYSKCILSGTDCSSILFIDCTFFGSDLSLVNLAKTCFRDVTFKDCYLHEADFTESDLTAAIFDHCDLARATFDHTILEKADFRTAVNYSIDPENNKIKKARFSVAGIAGLLDKYDIDID